VIDGLHNLLAETKQPGLPELRCYLEKTLAAEGGSGRIIEVTKLLRSRVFRVKIELNDAERSLVIKRLSPELAYRERRVVERWLPRIEMDGYGPPLLGSAAEASGRCVWHVYEDLGPFTLDKHLDDESSVLAATQLIADLHRRSAEHSVLAECRVAGGDFGMWFYESSIRDGIRNLAALGSDPRSSEPKQRRLLDKLLERMNRLWEQRTYRAEAMAELGGPETLLHGDLWTTNIFVMPGEKKVARLIDWDHIGVGQVAYDLSTLLLRFPAERRREVLDAYYAAIAPLGWQLPSTDNFNLLCETAEFARLASATVWSAISAHEDPTEWAFEELDAIDQWFEALSPILPVAEAYERALGSQS
jgi:hypothetical protein